MKAMLRMVVADTAGEVEYPCLAFVCPGCAEAGGSGLHMLPVNTDKKSPAWKWNGDLEAPTLEPSILTKRGGSEEDPRPSFTCHSYLRNGVMEYLGDCTHGFKEKHVPLPELPDWFTREMEA